MIIDIVALILLIISLVLGIRRGLIVQLCHLIGLYIAIMVAPDIATPIGLIFFDNPGIAFIVGFILVVAVVLLFVWIVAPLLRKLLFWNALRAVDSLLGAILSVATMVIAIAAACSIFNTMNLGELKAEKLIALGASHPEVEEHKAMIAQLQERKADMRDYYEPRYVEFEYLDSSIIFNHMSKLGDMLVPNIKKIETEMTNFAVETIVSEYGTTNE